jgi:hypothetical protein
MDNTTSGETKAVRNQASEDLTASRVTRMYSIRPQKM